MNRGTGSTADFKSDVEGRGHGFGRMDDGFGPGVHLYGSHLRSSRGVGFQGHARLKNMCHFIWFKLYITWCYLDRDLQKTVRPRQKRTTSSLEKEDSMILLSDKYRHTSLLH